MKPSRDLKAVKEKAVAAHKALDDFESLPCSHQPIAEHKRLLKQRDAPVDVYLRLYPRKSSN